MFQDALWTTLYTDDEIRLIEEHEEQDQQTQKDVDNLVNMFLAGYHEQSINQEVKMSVSELIKELQEIEDKDQDIQVCDNNGYYGSLRLVEEDSSFGPNGPFPCVYLSP